MLLQLDTVSALPDYTGLTAAALATGGAITLINNQINTVNYTGAAVGGVTLPAATAGDVCVYVQSVDTTGGVNALTLNAAGTDVWGYRFSNRIKSRCSSNS